MRRLWAGVVLGGLALTVLAPPAGAQQREGTEIEVDAGYGGAYLAGRRLPVHVTVRADRLVRGTLEVSVPGQPGSWSLDVEVAGGGVSRFVVVVPTPATFPVREVDVRLVGAGEPVTAEVDVDPLGDEELVGLLPDVAPPDLPAPLALPAEAGTARFVSLRLDTLGVAGVLDPLGTLVAGPAELGRLPTDARANVLDWVDRGGRLLVDGPPGSPVAGLPDEWQPGPTGRAAAGLGEVRATDGSATAGRWGGILEPTPTVSFDDMNRLGGIPLAGIEGVGDAVARDAGLSALELPWLLAFLLAYVALVGPVAWLALRRRRAVLGWIAVPVTAAVFTGASFVVGADLRSGTSAAHGTSVEIGPGGARATTILGLVSRNGRDGRGRFPEGWTAGGIDGSFFGFGPAAEQGGNELSVRDEGDGVRAVVPLAAGGFGVLRGSGPTDPPGGLVVDVRSEGDAVVGTVHNDMPFALEEVGVILGRATERLGDIPAGATAEFRLEGQELTRRDPYSPPEATLWPAQAGYGPQPDFESVVNLGVWNETHLALGPNARTRGIVTVVGWTRGLGSPGSVAGEGSPAGRSAVVARSPVRSADGGVAPGSAHRELVRGPDAVELPDADVPSRVVGTLWRFSLPAGANAPLVLDVPAYLGRVEAWDGDGWRVVADRLDRIADFNGDLSRVETVDLPADVVADGVVWLRGWVLTDFGSLDGAGLEVRSA